MKLKYKALHLSILLMLSSAAMATTNPPNPCGNHGNNCDPETPSTPNTNTQGQAQGQGQGQGQGQQQGQTANGGHGTGVGVGIGQGGSGGAGGQGGNSTAGALSGSLSGVTGSGNSRNEIGVGDVGSNSSAGAYSGGNNLSNGSASLSGASNGDQTTTNTNGGNTTSSGASADGSGNADTDVTVGGDQYEGSQTVYQAAMPSAPPIFGPASAAVVSYGQCGPYTAVESEQVDGVYLGLFRKHKINLGRTDRIVAYNGESFKEKRLPDGRWYLEGLRAVRTTAVLNVSGSRQVSLGGGDTGGGYGQAGAGGGSSMQRVVSTIDLEPCVAYIAEPAVQTPVIEFKEPRVPRG